MNRSSRIPTGGLAFYQTLNGRQKRRREFVALAVALTGLVFSAAVVQQLISPAAPSATASAYAYFNH
ncbi:MAG: hypothetical protein JWM33_3817 [Caulobacteraceae bacterium]|nr:hypothetical protein [Caulobacteraceae bacterium]